MQTYDANYKVTRLTSSMDTLLCEISVILPRKQCDVSYHNRSCTSTSIGLAHINNSSTMPVPVVHSYKSPIVSKRLRLRLPSKIQSRFSVLPARSDDLPVALSSSVPSERHVRAVGRKLGPVCRISSCSSNLRSPWKTAYPLLIRMQLARREYVGIYVTLCAFAKVLILFEYLPVEFANVVELFVGSILVAVDFIFDLAGRGRSWHHALDVEKVITSKMSAVFYRSDILRRLTCKSPMWLDSRRLLLV